MNSLLCAFFSQIFFLLTTYKAVEHDMWELFSKTDLECKVSKIFPSHTANTKAVLFKNIITKVLQKKLKILVILLDLKERRMLMMQLYIGHHLYPHSLEINHFLPVKMKMIYLTSLILGERIIYTYKKYQEQMKGLVLIKFTYL